MRRDQEPAKPRRRFSKRITVAVMVWGMVTTWLAMFLTPDLAAVVIPTAAGAVTLSLGAYMGAGHADYRVAQSQPSFEGQSWSASAMSPGLPIPVDPMEERHDRTG